MKEWVGSYWYVLRCGALQAKATLTDTQAADLVAWFKGFSVSLPCPECCRHYTDDFVVFPFDVTHARDPMRAMFWVEELRRRIEERKHAAAAAAPKGNAAASAASKTQALAETATTTATTTATATTAAVGTAAVTETGVKVASAPRPQPRFLHTGMPMSFPRAVAPAAAANNAVRKLAIQSAMQQTIANRTAEKAGVTRGCGCGKKGKKTSVA